MTGAEPTTEAPDAGRWFDVTTAHSLGPGITWDFKLYPVLHDVRSALRIEVAADGAPRMACLSRTWWHGPEDGIGEDVTVLSAIRFASPREAAALPAPTPRLEALDVPRLGLRLAKPSGWSDDDDAADEALWLWRDDEDGEPSIRVTRMEVRPRRSTSSRASPTTTSRRLWR